jgi:nitroreductase
MTFARRHGSQRGVAAALMAAIVSGAAGTAVITLPAPQSSGGKPLLQALAERRSTRSFAPQPLPPPLLANLLWAAFGVNRPAGAGVGGRTAPSAHDQQEIDVYLISADGSFRYVAKPPHRLERIGTADLRAGADSQGLARAAPLTLLYVADERRMTERDDAPTRRFYAAVDAGTIAQNVYLFCASEQLATVVFISFHRDRLARALGLAATQHIVLAQAVGYAKERS